MSESARIVIEVGGGIIPGSYEGAFVRRWAITSSEWWDRDETGQRALLKENMDEAIAYERELTLLIPGRLNWVRLDAIYF